MNRSKLFLLGMTCQILGGAGVAPCMGWWPVGLGLLKWVVLVLWFLAVAWAAASVAVDPRTIRKGIDWSLWGARAGFLLGGLHGSVLSMFAGSNPHGGPTPFSEILLLGLVGGVGSAVVLAAVGFVVGVSLPVSLDRKGELVDAPET